MFIDSHCHLGFKDLGEYTEHSDKILQEASLNGVNTIIDIATDIIAFEKAIAFSRNKNMIFTALGIHPLHIDGNLNFTKQDIIQHLHEPKVIAIGETGLDYYYSVDSKKVQKNFLEVHAEICEESKLPIIIHTRSAEADTVDILSSFVKNSNLKGVIHCFSGNKDFAKKLLDIGFYISFSGIVTFKNAVDIQQVAKYVPADHILTETDAPFLAPIPFRGKTNQPAYVKHTAEFIAQLRGESLTEFTSKVKSNFFDLFQKAR
ncbi:MAG: TatD family hydrolase [Alphaproteobacteria bacterium]|jgi:TatD DNase family protein|nr:TatD family hydrolase [Alphaproteobacteria bacterium]